MSGKTQTQGMKSEETKTEKLNLFQKMLMVTQEIATVAKNLEVETGIKGKTYKAVSEADVLRAVKPIEAKWGIYSFPFSRKIEQAEVFTKKTDYGEKTSMFLRLSTVYRFLNVDNPAEFIDITAYGDGVDAQDKAAGKAMTYSDKYALMKAYKIQTGDDPDAEGSDPDGIGTKQPRKQDLMTEEQRIELENYGVDFVAMAKFYGVSNAKQLTSAHAAHALSKKRGGA